MANPRGDPATRGFNRSTIVCVISRNDRIEWHRLTHAQPEVIVGCVFISYRRDDSPDTVARIYQALTAQLPNQKIFRDIDGIPLGKEFPDLLREKLAEASTILVIIGPRWLEILKHRKSAPVDYVRDEIRIALESQAEVIPVTVGGANMPSETDLADFPELLPLTRRSGIAVRLGRCGVAVRLSQ